MTTYNLVGIYTAEHKFRGFKTYYNRIETCLLKVLQVPDFLFKTYYNRIETALRPSAFVRLVKFKLNYSRIETEML